MRGGVVRSEFEGSLELCNGRIEICLLQICSAKVFNESRVLLAQVNSCLKLWDCRGRVSRLHQRKAEVVVHVRVLWTQSDHLPECGDRIRHFAVALQQHPKALVGFGKIW